MKRTLTTLALGVWALLMLWFWVSGRVADYLHPQFHTGVAIAGFGLLALLPLWLWATARNSRVCCSCSHEDHDHGHRAAKAWSVLVFAVLVVPVAMAAFVSPGQFGEAALRNRGLVGDVSLLPSAPPLGGSWETAPTVADSDNIPDVADLGGDEGVEYFTRAADGAIQLEIIDLLYAAQEPALRETFENERVAVVGQYAPATDKNSSDFDLVRMFVVCCAADARPLGVRVLSTEKPDVPGMAWVRATGVARFVGEGEAVEPRLELEKVEPVDPPADKLVH